jgi:hypothetical protein
MSIFAILDGKGLGLYGAVSSKKEGKGFTPTKRFL